MAGLLVLAALSLLVGIPGGDPSSDTYRFTRQSNPHVHTVLGWMVGSSASKVVQAVSGDIATHEDAVAYFALAGRLRTLEAALWASPRRDSPEAASMAAELSSVRAEMDRLASGVERLIQAEVADALLDAGLGCRLLGREILVPPLVFRFESPPDLLVVSPRSRIERLGSVLLNPRLTVQQAEELEDTVAAGEYSALVTSIGGLGVYPSMVPENSDIRWTLRTVVHEWAHHFLALRPLGWRYAFGAEDDNRMVMLNETVADILGRELGDALYERSYAGARIEQPRTSSRRGDFNRMMRDIRHQVDSLLAEGKIEEAERFMEEARQALAREGYSIRKLNQAYFAFYGSYADDPSFAGTRGEEISGRVHALRDSSRSVGDFLWTISGTGSFDEFLRTAPGP